MPEEANIIKREIGNFNLTDHNDIYSFGEPGEDADVWEIRGGYWWRNGINLGIKAEGVDGTKLESVEVLYAVSDTGIEPPENGWDVDFPITEHGKYIWTKVTWYYDDETSKTSYSAAYIGDDAYTVILSNESHTFKGGLEEAIPGETTKVKITVFKDFSEVDTIIGEPNIGTTGMDWSKDGSIITFTTTADTELSGVIDIPIVVDSIELVRSFSYSISLKGETGIPAKVITLNASSQIFTEVEGRETTPSQIEVVGSSQGVSIETWEYSINQGVFIETPFPFGITKDSGENIVRVDSSFMSGDIESVSIRASGGGVSDVFTIYKIVEANVWEVGSDGFWYKNGELQEGMIAVGKDGLDGVDAYEEAVMNGFEGERDEFYESLGQIRNFDMWLEDDGLKLIERIGTTLGHDGELQGIVGTKITDIEAGKIKLSENTEGKVAGLVIDSNNLAFSTEGKYFKIGTGDEGFIQAGTKHDRISFKLDHEGLYLYNHLDGELSFTATNDGKVTIGRDANSLTFDGNSLTLGSNVRINYSQINGRPYIPSVPSYITSTKITSTTIESPTISGNILNAGTINGGYINIYDTNNTKVEIGDGKMMIFDNTRLRGVFASARVTGIGHSSNAVGIYISSGSTTIQETQFKMGFSDWGGGGYNSSIGGPYSYKNILGTDGTGNNRKFNFNLPVDFLGGTIGVSSMSSSGESTTNFPFVSISNGNIAAQSFSDTTPIYTGNALLEIEGISGDEKGGIDHNTLPEFAQVEIKVPLPEGQEETQQENSLMGITTTEPEYIQGRDLGAMVSILTKAVQELMDKNKEQDQLIENLTQELTNQA